MLLLAWRGTVAAVCKSICIHACMLSWKYIYVYVCVCMCPYVCIHVWYIYICMYIYIYICVYAYICVCVYIWMHTCMCVCMCVHMYNAYVGLRFVLTLALIKTSTRRCLCLLNLWREIILWTQLKWMRPWIYSGNISEKSTSQELWSNLKLFLRHLYL